MPLTKNNRRNPHSHDQRRGGGRSTDHGGQSVPGGARRKNGELGALALRGQGPRRMHRSSVSDDSRFQFVKVLAGKRLTTNCFAALGLGTTGRRSHNIAKARGNATTLSVAIKMREMSREPPSHPSFPPGNFFLWMSLVRTWQVPSRLTKSAHGSEVIALAGLCGQPFPPFSPSF